MRLAIHHPSAEAEKRGMNAAEMTDLRRSKAGAPLPASCSAIDLPFKMLLRKDERKDAARAFGSPITSYLAKRHRLPPEFIPNIVVIQGLTAQAAA